jgi:hypothetical protein
MSSSHALRDRLQHLSAERVSAATYGSVLVLAALPLIHVDDVKSGLGWELVTGIGVATWVAHLFAELLGEQVRDPARFEFSDLRHAMVDGLPILLAAVVPAVMLLLGRLEVFDENTALWAALVVALVQLLGLGAFVGFARPGVRAWVYALGTGVVGVIVVVLKLALSH